ncbi:MAG: LysM peptidoglycan-binding domain-containing protein [Tepidiformaceae bacterium]
MSEPACHYCDRPAEEECPTCGRFYCPEHGDDVCLRCMAPESAAPSLLAYRGSVLALVVASVVALFLFIRPPESKSNEDTPRTIATSTPSFLATATATRPGAATPARTATATTAGGATTVTATPGGNRTYTIQANDTLSGIASRFETTVDAITALNPGLDPAALQPGATIQLPPAR